MTLFAHISVKANPFCVLTLAFRNAMTRYSFTELLVWQKTFTFFPQIYVGFLVAKNVKTLTQMSQFKPGQRHLSWNHWTLFSLLISRALSACWLIEVNQQKPLKKKKVYRPAGETWGQLLIFSIFSVSLLLATSTFKDRSSTVVSSILIEDRDLEFTNTTVTSWGGTNNANQELF